MQHGVAFPLQWGDGSVVRFADRPADRLIVFIHGFGGNARTTWRGMEQLFEAPELATADVVFFGYDSVAAPAQNSATEFRDFLEKAVGLTPPWTYTMVRAHMVPWERDYRDILIVAHSLGAVVVRRALLDSIEEGWDWVGRTRILLFGPAHMGTRLMKFAAMLRSGFSSILSDLYVIGRVKAPVLDDLEQGSDFLKDLLEESKAMPAGGQAPPIRAEAVIFGRRENVVLTKRFCKDPLSKVWPGHDHRSVCRAPQAAYEVIRHL